MLYIIIIVCINILILSSGIIEAEIGVKIRRIKKVIISNNIIINYSREDILCFRININIFIFTLGSFVEFYLIDFIISNSSNIIKFFVLILIFEVFGKVSILKFNFVNIFVVAVPSKNGKINLLILILFGLVLFCFLNL